MKRLVDLVASLVGSVLLLPFFGILAILVKVETPGPVFFRQERVGRDGRLFRIWKFRTMADGAESLGPGVTVAGDPRITRIGRWMRAWKVDELPQLWNVLRGEMSMVGPRPELPRYVALYDAREREVLDHRPGITDPASLAYRNEDQLLSDVDDWHGHYVDVIMRDKLALNLEYLRRATVFSDVRLMATTLYALVRPKTMERGRP